MYVTNLSESQYASMKMIFVQPSILRASKASKLRSAICLKAGIQTTGMIITADGK